MLEFVTCFAQQLNHPRDAIVMDAAMRETRFKEEAVPRRVHFFVRHFYEFNFLLNPNVQYRLLD
jgi:hypothetical protein